MRTHHPTGTTAGSYSVFAIANARLREVYVGVAPADALDAKPLRLPASVPILRWGLEGNGLLDRLADGLDADAAQSFAENQARMALPPGWTYLR